MSAERVFVIGSGSAADIAAADSMRDAPQQNLFECMSAVTERRTFQERQFGLPEGG